MATEPKAAAALTAGLLARRGLAKPAMRRQTVSGLGPRAVDLDDLGWNDMGDDKPAYVITPSPVAKQIDAIAETFVQPSSVVKTEAPAKPKAKKVAPPAPVALPKGRKSAFTLRIDAERHLRLRLLSAVTNQSAQQLITSALDTLLAAHPDIDALAADPKVRGGSTNSGPKSNRE